jgi:hypothetical protein
MADNTVIIFPLVPMRVLGPYLRTLDGSGLLVSPLTQLEIVLSAKSHSNIFPNPS